VRLPPLNSLVVFEAAARHQSFTRAAEVLCVTQAAVSHQIKTLENWLGVPLFHRLGRGYGLVLTEAGRAYLARIGSALESLRSATEAVMDSRRRVLRIGTLDSFGSLWLLPRLGKFIADNGETDVRVLAADLDADMLTTGAVDIDIRYGEGDWPDVEATHFLSETIFPVCAPQLLAGPKPLRTPADLKHHRLLHDVMVIDWRTWLESAGATDIDADRGPGFNHSHLVIQAAISGDGVALGRSALVADALRRGALVRPFELSLPSRFSYFTVRSNASLGDPAVEKFRSWLIDEGRSSQRQFQELQDTHRG
jgi:LysR family transcriptional regulator, glycine cleavage system transcriptional activator